MTTTEENKFFRIFQDGGVASLCVDVLIKKYDLGFLQQGRNHGGIPYASYLRWIVEKQDTVNVDFDKIFEEIEDNLVSCPNDMEREIYVSKLIAPFGGYLMTTRPVLNVTGNSKERAQRIEHRFSILSSFRYNSHVGGFIKLGVVKMFRCCERLLTQYARRLDWVLMRRGIDLMKIQKDCGVYLLDSYRYAVHYIEWAGSIPAAKKYISGIENKGIHTEASDGKKDKIRTVIECFTDPAKEKEVRQKADGKTGAALFHTLEAYRKQGILNSYPSYNSLVKYWDFPNDKKLAACYNQAKKGK